MTEKHTPPRGTKSYIRDAWKYSSTIDVFEALAQQCEAFAVDFTSMGPRFVEDWNRLGYHVRVVVDQFLGTESAQHSEFLKKEHK
jgi:hypothetical protein